MELRKRDYPKAQVLIGENPEEEENEEKEENGKEICRRWSGRKRKIKWNNRKIKKKEEKTEKKKENEKEK